MGKLDFSELAVRMLGKDYAVVTGKYHLARTEGGGGEASGVFSLIFEREGKGEREPDAWRIILDHTS
jgi:ketosteroid isomerase-like protein